MDQTPFITETVLVLMFSLVLLCVCLRQLYHDVTQGERFRPLVVSHYLNTAASVCVLVGNIDSQGGHGLYSQAFLFFVGNMRSVFLIASARALAAGFVASYALIIQGSKSTFATNSRLLVSHCLVLTISSAIFLALWITRNAWLALGSRIFISAYSLVVGGQVVVSALKVRKILIEEHARVGKYADGINKLTRLTAFAIVLVFAGNLSIYILLPATIQYGKTTGVMPEQNPQEFDAFHIFADFSGLISISVLVLGSWKVGPAAAKSGGSKKTTRSSTTVSAPSQTTNPKLPGSTSEEAKSEILHASLAPGSPAYEEHKDDNSSKRKVKPVDAEAPSSPPEDNSSHKRRMKLGGYQEIEAV